MPQSKLNYNTKIKLRSHVKNIKFTKASAIEYRGTYIKSKPGTRKHGCAYCHHRR